VTHPKTSLSKEEKSFIMLFKEHKMSGKSSFPYRKYDRRPHPHIVKQILEDGELVEMMKEVLIQEGKPCPFCHRKLKDERKDREIW
jgi:hypothetical protein